MSDARHVELIDEGRAVRLYRNGDVFGVVRCQSLGAAMRIVRLWLCHAPVNGWLARVEPADASEVVEAGAETVLA